MAACWQTSVANFGFIKEKNRKSKYEHKIPRFPACGSLSGGPEHGYFPTARINGDLLVSMTSTV